MAREEKNMRPTRHRVENFQCLLLEVETDMFYYRMNVYIVEVLSSWERIFKVVKECRVSGEIFWEEFFFMPTHGFLIFFRCLFFGPQNIFNAYSLSTPLPPGHK